MKKSEIKVGGHYMAKVSGKIVTVRVDKIRDREGFKRTETCYDVTNLTTGRKTTFRSAAKFRCEAPSEISKRQQGREGLNSTALEPDSDSCEHVWMIRPDNGKEWCPKCQTVKGEGKQGSDPTPTVGTAETQNSKPSERMRDGVTASSDSPLAAKPATAPKRKATPAQRQALTDLIKGSRPPVASGSRPVAAPHLIIEARAGTGKTTTLVEGLRGVLTPDQPSKLVPSPQQKAIWDAMAQGEKPRTCCFVAFNKSIATELQRRVPAGCDAMTMHSMGYRAVIKALGRQEPNQYAVQDIIEELLGHDIRWLRANKPTVLKATEELVSLCKMNLTEPARVVYGLEETEDEDWNSALDQLAAHYEVDLNGSRAEVFDLVPRVLERCKTPKGKITFDDMIWLPVVLNLPVFQYDLLLVDEAQDLNRCQQALAKKAGKRLILCGDPKQAIYGFAGADSESMRRMERELSCQCNPPCSSRIDYSCGRNCITLPLTVTRRCGKAIVEEARRIVPDFEAHESNGEGKISRARYPKRDEAQQPRSPDGRELAEHRSYDTFVADGDMVLCRVNAPLVSQCFRFLKAGRKATIQGRDVGQGLISTVKKLSKDDPSITAFVSKLTDWLNTEQAKEYAKRNPNEAKVIALQDRCDCLICFTEGATVVGDVIRKIEAVFTDDKNSPGIRLSSIHKAKGLEARRVFLLEPEGATVPHPMAKSAWQREQEMNLRYVAITRAIEELVFVS